MTHGNTASQKYQFDYLFRHATTGQPFDAAAAATSADYINRKGASKPPRYAAKYAISLMVDIS